MKIICIFCVVVLSSSDIVKDWEKVGFSRTHRGSSQNLEVNGKSTGCMIVSMGIDLTCKDRAESSEVPSNAFHALVNCQDMDATKFDLLTIEPGPFCGKLTYTQHFQPNSAASIGSLQIKPGQVANLTCVLFPLGNSKYYSDTDGWTTAKTATVDVMAKNSKNGESGTIKDVPLGSLRYRQDKEDGQFKVEAGACAQAVKEIFNWQLKLVNSSQNVHQVLFTSQPTKPTDQVFPPVKVKDTLPSEVTGCLKDVGYYDLHESVIQAIIPKGRGEWGKLVKIIDLERLPKDHREPEKHEELVKVMVDASQLPKGTENLKVLFNFGLPGPGPSNWDGLQNLLLPVDDPTIPDRDTTSTSDQPEQPDQPDQPVEPDQPDQPDQPDPKQKSSSLVPWTWILACILLVGLGTGGFLYRRHRLIQATRGREVLP